MTDCIFKILTAVEWQGTQEEGVFTGSPADRESGFIHLSTAAQVRETAQRHFSGQENLALLWVDPARIGKDLKWEPSRRGLLFPHLYGDLPLSAVIRCDQLNLDEAGCHSFPADVPTEDKSS